MISNDMDDMLPPPREWSETVGADGEVIAVVSDCGYVFGEPASTRYAYDCGPGPDRDYGWRFMG